MLIVTVWHKVVNSPLSEICELSQMLCSLQAVQKVASTMYIMLNPIFMLIQLTATNVTGYGYQVVAMLILIWTGLWPTLLRGKALSNTE